MKFLRLSAALLLSAAVSAVHAAGDEALVKEARSLAMQFGGQLKGAVAEGLKSGGPAATVEICSVKAPQIAADVATESGWDVGRTTLKLRNPNNAPDDWERQVLEQFEERKAAGEPVAELEFAEVVGSGDERRFRFMKAIGTEPVCLTCHAADITPDVEAKLGMLYPQDKARGFAVGDIRGAFTLSKPY